MTLQRAAIVLGALFAACLLPLPRTLRADTLSITSTPPGAAVEIDGVAAGTTPLIKDYPGGYFHKPHSVFGSRLDHKIVARVSLTGYATQEIVLTEGPLPWLSYTGRSHGTYWIFKADRFDVTLLPSAQPIRSKIQIAPGDLKQASLRVTKTAEDLAKDASPAVVRIRGDSILGSGFLITDSGVIATSRHVIDGQTTLTATTWDGQNFVASVVYTDSNADFALLKIDGSGYAHLAIAGMGEVKPGESVIAIGNPGGGLPNTVTKGIVSAVGPNAELGPGTWIQTDAAINPGNSGGPLLDDLGNVIGINTLKAVRNNAGQPVEGINFALSTQVVLEALRRFYPDAISERRAADEGGFGSVNVSSDPAGADIYLDGKFVGNTPSMLHLSAGPHKIQIQAAKTKSWERNLDVLKDSEITLRATLEPQP
ncbi:MAG: trypsin-like peptidase domain-containing protein [Candidatus Acidiferrales bacterium]